MDFGSAWSSRDRRGGRLANILGALIRTLGSLIVPPLCAACREPDLAGAGLCEECRSQLVVLGQAGCERCGAPLGHRASRCGECLGRPLAFDRAWAPFAYEGVARQVVAALKSRGAVAAARPMAREMAVRAPAGLLAGVMVPVPAHRERLRRHGFNQAESLANALARAKGLPVKTLLRRQQGSRPQAGLERHARLEGPSASVSAMGPVPARAVVVDDVYTTGATLDACARALRERGAREVVAVTFSRALRA